MELTNKLKKDIDLNINSIVKCIDENNKQDISNKIKNIIYDAIINRSEINKIIKINDKETWKEKDYINIKIISDYSGLTVKGEYKKNYMTWLNCGSHIKKINFYLDYDNEYNDYSFLYILPVIIIALIIHIFVIL